MFGKPKDDGDQSGQIIATLAEVTLNAGLVKESPQNPLNSGLGIILICPDQSIHPLFVAIAFARRGIMGGS